jgi:hypothetical protein
VRLDLIEHTRHHQFALEDFRRLQEFGISTVRTGARWHVIEYQPGKYDFESLSVIVHAARATGVELLVDLLHFGWPDGLDIFCPTFLESYASFVRALTKFMKAHRDVCTVFAPVNEISFLSWAGGEVAAINPFARNRGVELKRILVRAVVLASQLILKELPGARLLAPEPVIHIVGNPEIPGDEAAAEQYRLAQFEAWDMIAGLSAPELGGRPEFLDIIGTNFYDRNQWVNHAETLLPGDNRYRPFRQILQEIWRRYHRPIVVSETGREDDERAAWFDYVSTEVLGARNRGIPVHGICLYPILNHPGWDDGRHCLNGLFDYADSTGHRELYQPLADAICRWQKEFLGGRKGSNDSEQNRSDLFFPSSLGFRVPATSTSDEPVCT